MQRRGETLAFAALGMAAVVTIVCGVNKLRDSVAQYEFIDATLAKPPPQFVVTNAAGRSPGSYSPIRAHGASPAPLVF